MTIDDAIQLAITPAIQDLRRESECVEQIKGAIISAGFAIVPREPTREMWAAGGNAAVGKTAIHHDQVVGPVWAAMVEASPR